MGMFNMSGVLFSGTPGQKYCMCISINIHLEISIESDAIDANKPSNKEYLSSLNTNESQISFNFNLELRLC